ncbi:DnaJ family domain-containing protein [Paenibacillus sp. sgz5001063]|uniref:DnaJ family domain-containing protein n=1 Tax=Paenibacillus sp. sgz5001063 TaxID=3242474 RepID=UPI0036D336DC
MTILSWLAEQKIQEAMRSGAFENLPGHGKPLQLEDLSGVPEDLRMSFKIMKNAGLVPEEVTLRGECVTLEKLLASCHSSGSAADGERNALKSQLTLKRLRLQELMRQRGYENSSAFSEYGDKIQEQLAKEE